MIIEEHFDEKYVAIWVANFEKNDVQIQTSIRRIVEENQKKKIKTVIFSSGNESLREMTANLLDYSAEKKAPNRKINREDIDLFTTMWYNCLTGTYPFHEVNPWLKS